MVFLGSTPIGAPIAGWLGQLLGPRMEFAVMGVVALGVGAVVLLLRRRAAAVAELEFASSGAHIAAR